ncbi:MAG: metallophosphoesterase family protein [Thermoplasmata archaeon]|nr:metallophosphoesterase family protein [Thermoplasmata archaeon]
MNPGSELIVISDVHANIIALREIYKRFNFGIVIHAGDIIGYNPYPYETIQFFIKQKIKTILGNHDRALINGDTFGLNEYASMAIEWTMQHLDNYSIEYLKSLKKSIKMNIFGKRVAVYHGSPKNDDEYIYEEDLEENIIPKDVDVLILGHTHIPYVKRFNEKIVINPGSVGQPRDGDPRASFVRIDENWNARIERVEYDIEEVYKKIEESGLPDFLGTRLFKGI